MYILPHEAMELLQITTRQGLHKIVVNHNITVKSQGAGKPNLYLKSDVEKYRSEIISTGKDKYNKHITEKAIKIKKEKVKIKEKVKKLKIETKKELKIIDEEPIEDIFKDEKITTKELSKSDDIENPLNKVGMAEYERVTELLKEQGTYKEIDRALVLAYAISYQKYIFSTIASGKEDDTFIDAFGNIKKHPYSDVAKDNFKQMVETCKILGIGAKSRIGIEIKEPKKESIFDILNEKEEF